MSSAITSSGRETLRRLRSASRHADRPTPDPVAAWELDPDGTTPTLRTDDLPALTLADLVATSPLPAVAALSALRDVAATLDAVYATGVGHGDLRPATVLVLPDGRAALARPDAPPTVKRNGRGRARQEDNHAFAELAAALLTDPPGAAAAVLADALEGDLSRRPAPHALLESLAEVPTESWTSTLRPLVEVERLDPEPLEPEPLERPEVIRLGSWPASMPATFAAPPEPAVPLRFIPDGVEERQRQRPPTRDRTLVRKVMEPFVVLAGFVLVAAGAGGGAFLLLSPSSSAGDPGATTPQVRRAAVSVTPPHAQCPHASMHVAITIVVDGGEGDLQVRWRLPDGRVAHSQTVSVDDGDDTLRAAFDLTFAGNDSVVGDVVAIISPVGVRASAPIRYVCPTERRNPDRATAA
ncbi:hypothetical protein DJ010_16095 [Nocardioides silvaticus]|uniref:Protein kinase domain-containing protein n=1 Tax=Nocardioides silvaticus TaxID=2201891 RepID=A0A316TE32_9ACTN|nr:hypothetical protein [Nocardioides silvaticus]PWN02048.1 hypothetical protein DJ010_16095 [Nocardioides silvaticus]